MEINYTAHLEFRLKTRDIPYDLPRRVFELAQERYYDNLSKHSIAIHQIKFGGKIREMVLVYDKKRNSVEIITMHPIKLYQKYSRIHSGRWVRYEQ